MVKVPDEYVDWIESQGRGHEQEPLFKITMKCVRNGELLPPITKENVPYEVARVGLAGLELVLILFGFDRPGVEVTAEVTCMGCGQKQKLALKEGGWCREQS